MIIIKNKQAIVKMTKAGSLLSKIFENLADKIKPGVSTLDLDAYIEHCHKQLGLVPRSKGYRGYQHASCISINDEVVHGVPSAKRILTEYDLVKVDICSSWKGYCADMARCFWVGSSPSKGAQKLVQAAQDALNAAIDKIKIGIHLSDVSVAVQDVVEKRGFGVVRDFAGHGIGKDLHEDPEILNYGKKRQGPILRPGMTLAIEPMITMGDYKVYLAEDGWTAKTVDGSLAAHVEDTILVTDEAPIILTRP